MRLSEALARLKLAETVTADDVEEALRLMKVRHIARQLPEMLSIWCYISWCNISQGWLSDKCSEIMELS